MNNSMLEILRIEGADLDAITRMPNLLPIRLGDRSVGQAKIDRHVGDRFFLDLGGNEKHHFTAKQFLFPKHRCRSFCLLCPKCEEWRKRLFLNDVSFGPLSKTFTHSFECKDCLASSSRKKARRSKPSERIR
jgi:hypothetical protein